MMGCIKVAGRLTLLAKLYIRWGFKNSCLRLDKESMLRIV